MNPKTLILLPVHLHLVQLGILKLKHFECFSCCLVSNMPFLEQLKELSLYEHCLVSPTKHCLFLFLLQDPDVLLLLIAY